MYNWEFKSWPKFQYDESKYKDLEREFYLLQGESEGIISTLESNVKQDSIVDLLVKEAIKTSEIEGEFISRIDLVSSIKRNLGLSTHQEYIRDKRSIGLSKALVNSRESFAKNLSKEMICAWQSDILAHDAIVKKEEWRTHIEPMQVISGRYGKEEVHFEAPPTERVEAEMTRYIQWFNSHNIQNPIVFAAISHLYFESIHPFEDGNGRIGRILAEKAISKSIGMPILFSISQSIEQERLRYYRELKKASHTLEIHDWIEYYGQVIIQAEKLFQKSVRHTINKSKFISKIEDKVQDKQMKVLLKMLEEEEFVGGMNAAKYISITKISKATATRDLADLVQKNILKSNGKGRGTSYEINFE